jgi:hypothetical protein
VICSDKNCISPAYLIFKVDYGSFQLFRIGLTLIVQGNVLPAGEQWPGIRLIKQNTDILRQILAVVLRLSLLIQLYSYSAFDNALDRIIILSWGFSHIAETAA